MSKAAMNLQDSFLNQVRRENSEVRVLLVNGTLLRGSVKGFDNFTLILNNRNGQHLVYKHAIAQIVTHRPHVKTEDAPSAEPRQSADAPEAAAEENASAQPADNVAGHETGSSRREGQQHRDKKPRQPRQDQQKAKKEGFNTLDLSGVKLGEK